jgi:hypothetical protein
MAPWCLCTLITQLWQRSTGSSSNIQQFFPFVSSVSNDKQQQQQQACPNSTVVLHGGTTATTTEDQTNIW